MTYVVFTISYIDVARLAPLVVLHITRHSMAAQGLQPPADTGTSEGCQPESGYLNGSGTSKRRDQTYT